MSEKYRFHSSKNYANPSKHSEEILRYSTNILQKIFCEYVLVIARSRVQYEKYFSSSFCFRNISRAEGE